LRSLIVGGEEDTEAAYARQMVGAVLILDGLREVKMMRLQLKELTKALGGKRR
jgi:hypothetical protein